MKKTTMLLIAGMACLIYGGTTWANGGLQPQTCQNRGFNACPPYDCERTSITMTNCPQGQTSTLTNWRSDGTMNGNCVNSSSGTCPGTFFCQIYGYILTTGQSCNDPFRCSGFIQIVGCP